MSHYSKITTKITKRNCLLKALVNMGFKSHMLEYSDDKMPLKGYQGDTRAQKANLRIKGSGWGTSHNYVGGASNDLGWELMEDGTYSMHVSDYDKSKYNQKWQMQLVKEYAREVIKEVSNEQNFFVESEEEIDGEIFIRVSSPF